MDMPRNMIGRLRCALATVALGAVAVAQVGFGDTAPPAAWRHWLQGEPMAFAGEAVPPCTVLAFYTRPGLAAQFASDGDYLASLQRRFADRGLAVVAVVKAADATALASWPGCRVAADAEAELTNAWLGAGNGPWHVIVLDQRGRVVLLGSPETGLVDAIEATLRGEDVIAATARAFSIRGSMLASFDDAVAADTVRALEDVLATALRDGLGVKGKALLLSEEVAGNLELAARNHPRVTAKRALGVEVVDLLQHDVVIFSEPALKALCEVLAR